MAPFSQDCLVLVPERGLRRCGNRDSCECLSPESSSMGQEGLLGVGTGHRHRASQGAHHHRPRCGRPAHPPITRHQMRLQRGHGLGRRQSRLLFPDRIKTISDGVGPACKNWEGLRTLSNVGPSVNPIVFTPECKLLTQTQWRLGHHLKRSKCSSTQAHTSCG
jgi:hypothetical protein